MRKKIILTIIMVSVMTFASFAFGQRPAVSLPFYVHLSGGIAKPSLNDVKENFDNIEQLIGGGNSIPGWDNFGVAPVFGLELGKQISATVMLGVKVSLQKNNVDSSATGSLAAFEILPEYSLFDFSARLKFLILETPGLYLGASGGYASGEYKESVDFRVFADASEDFQWASKYTGSGLSLGALAGYRFAVGRKVFLTGELEYKFRNLGTFDGSTNSPQFLDYEGPALDNSGEELDFDFSGVSLEIGILVLMRS
jgi:hypothetical protein